MIGPLDLNDNTIAILVNRSPYISSVNGILA